MVSIGSTGTLSSRAAPVFEGLEVANAINAYMDRANGDMRLALAMSVADGVVASKLVAGSASRAHAESLGRNGLRR